MDPSVPPLDGDRDRGWQLLATFWAESGVAITVIALRMWSRYKLRNRGLDDWIMLFTVVLVVASNIAITFAVVNGLGRHSYYLTPEQRVYNLKIGEYIAEPFAIIAIATGKASVAFLILRIIGPSTFWRKWIIYVSIPLTLLMNSLAVVFLFAQCNPPRVLWEGPKAVPGAKCWNPSRAAKFSVLDWVRSSDLSHTSMSMLTPHRAENFVIIICGSIPTLKPVYEKLRSIMFHLSNGKLGSFPSSSSSSYGTHRMNAKKPSPWSQFRGESHFGGSTRVTSRNRQSSCEVQYLTDKRRINIEREFEIISSDGDRDRGYPGPLVKEKTSLKPLGRNVKGQDAADLEEGGQASNYNR
ncbi:MAG: hypothetical protein Q9217_000567 [Psora testacea]